MLRCNDEKEGWINLFAAIYDSAVKENDVIFLNSPLADEIKGVLSSIIADKNSEEKLNFKRYK